MAAEAAKPLLGPASKDEGTEEAAPAPAVAAAGPLSEKSKTCSDAHCLVLFVVVWAINFGIFALALQRGDVYRLLYATDYQDNTCGRDAMAAKPWGFYPRLAEDVLYALHEPGNCLTDITTGALEDCTVDLYTVCVESCPHLGEIVCDYERQAELAKLAEPERSTAAADFAARRDRCWRTPISQDTTFHRCVPATDQILVTTTYECDGTPIATTKKGSCTGLLTETTLQRVNTTAGADVLMGALITTTCTIKEWFGDCWIVFWYILLYGGLLAMLLSGGFIIAQKFFAGPLVWTVILLLFLLLGACTFVFLIKGGHFFWLTLEDATTATASAVASTSAASYASYLETADGIEAKVWEYAGHVFFFVTIIYVLVICAVAARIGLTIELIKVTSEILKRTPLIVVAPVVEWLALLGLFVFATFGMGCIWTIDLTSADLASALESTTGLHCTTSQNIIECVESAVGAAGNITNSSVTASPAAAESTPDSLFYPLLGFHIFACLWCWQFYGAFKTVWVSSAVAEVYFTKEIASRRSPTLDSLCHTLRYRVGSVAFGSLILAMIKAVRIVLLYIETKVEEVQANSQTLKVAFCLCHCAVWCLEKCIRYLTHNAFIYIGIDGQSFCASALKTFCFLAQNPVRITFAQGMSRIFGYLAIAFVSTVSTLAAYYHFNAISAQAMSTDSTISNSLLPTMLVFVLSLLVAMAFTDVWNNGVDCVLFCYLHDEDKTRKGAYDSGQCVTKRDWAELYELMDKDYKKIETKEEEKERVAELSKRRQQYSKRVSFENEAKHKGCCSCCEKDKVAPDETASLNYR